MFKSVIPTNVYGSVLRPLSNPAVWSGRLNPLAEKISDPTGVPVERLRADLAIYARQTASWSLAIAAAFGRRFAQQLLTIVLAFVFLLPMLRSSDEFHVGALSILPLSRQRARELAVAVYEGIIADIYGVVAVAIAEGMLLALGFWAVGLHSSLL